MKKKTSFVDQSALTVIAPISADKKVKLEKLLNQIRGDIEKNTLLPFIRLESVHFCRIFILPGFEGVPDQLVYSVNHDGKLENHMDDITNKETIDGFFEIFSCCVGLEFHNSKKEAIIQFIKKYKKKIHTFYLGHRGLDLSLIRREEEIYIHIQDFLKKNANIDSKSNKEIKTAIEEYILTCMPDFKKSNPLKYLFLTRLMIIFIFVVLPMLLITAGIYFLLGLPFVLLFLAALILIVVLALVYIRHLEKNVTEMPESEIGNYNDIDKLSSIEDLQIQNQLTHLVELRPGTFRKLLQKLILLVLSILVKYNHNQGSLGGITSIHFARWLLIDDSRRLLFLSNYDGNWESYIGDFIDRNAEGLTLAWSNTKEFPKTRFLIKDGAKNEEYFKAWIRKKQIYTQVWYTAYKNLTVKNILRNHKIVSGIKTEMNDQEISQWLKLL